MSKATDAGAPTSNPLPSPAQLALALITIRLKPPEISVEEYLSRLTTSINRQPRHTARESMAHFDAAAFWKTAFESAEADKARLEAELAGLKQDQTPTASTHGRCRRTMQDDDDEPSISKRCRGYELEGEDVLRELEENKTPDIQRVLRAVRALQKALRQAESQMQDLSVQIQQLSRSVQVVLSSGSKGVCSHAQVSKPPTTAIEAVGSRLLPIYSCIIAALHQASSRPGGDTDALTPAYASINQLLQVLLGQLHQTALDETTRRAAGGQDKMTKPASNTKAVKRPPRVHNECHKPMRLLAQSIRLMFAALDVTKSSHCELLEGHLTALFDHIGSSIALLVFADPDEEEEGLLPSPGVEDVTHTDTYSAMTAALIEGPYLVAILKAVLSFVRDKQHLMSHKCVSAFVDATTENSERGAFLRQIEERLQGTLLRGIFGDEDGTIENCLTREALPEAGEEWIEDDEVDGDTGGSEWFIAQIWETLGWDILSGKITRTRRK